MKCNMNHRDDSYKPEHRPEREEYKYYRHPKPEPEPKPYSKHETETILKCGTSMGAVSVCNSNQATRIGVVDGLYHSPSTVLASVVLDTRDLIDPTVKIDFSSLISFKTYCENYFLHLVFKLSKVCNGSHVTLGTWTFEQSSQGGKTGDAAPADGGFVQETDAFCFSWCECEECPGCCRYMVELVDEQCYNIDFAVISNISLTALAVGEKKEY